LWALLIFCFLITTLAAFLQLIPCLALAALVHPSTSHNLINRILWAFCVYLEAVSVLPQLRVMQNTKVGKAVFSRHPFCCKHAWVKGDRK
jgi:ER lumen protein retaining receptor